MERRIEMSEREIERLKVLERVREGVMSQRQAAAQLGLTQRHVRRLKRRYDSEGAAGLVSRRRGKPSNRRTPERLKTAMMRVLRNAMPALVPRWRPSICALRATRYPRRRYAAG